MKRKNRIAMYLRLSQADSRAGAESGSIGNQRRLLRSYVEKHFENYELLEFQDDGYTGANFSRPGILALLEQAEKGRIDCVIVKDLSRFSRDYIETGAYLERRFPFSGVRFIAVNDGYDSDRACGAAAGMDTAFKNLINDLYGKDISVKVKASLAIKKDSGTYANGSCAFGYRKDPRDRHTLLIDDDEAAIVRRIFRMTADGYSSYEIARILNDEGIKTPIEYKMERGIASMKPKGGRFVWSGSTICQMLRNAVYVGDMVYNKYETPEAAGKSRLQPRSEWKTVQNHHEAIIDRNTFDVIQKSRGKRQEVRYPRHPLTGKIECGSCCRSLKLERTKNPYFFCGNRYVTSHGGCRCQVNVQFLEQYILFKLQEELDDREKRPESPGETAAAAALGVCADCAKASAETNLTDLTQEVVNKYLKKVIVYDEKRIEIKWNFAEDAETFQMSREV